MHSCQFLDIDPCTNVLEVVLKPTFPDDISRDEMLTQFMYLINQYSTDLRHSDDWPCHFCGTILPAFISGRVILTIDREAGT
jgi:hypothetical protein